MSKAFVKESGDEADALDDEQSDQSAGIPPGSKNYVTAEGHRAMRESLLKLMSVERPEVVRVVSWAASNGDRSENGDYIYGKRRLREIDRRIRYLSKRLDCAEVVDPSMHLGNDQIFFGAKVEFFRNGEGPESITIVGIDEVDSAPRRVS
ncbi:MAG: transcription elongation factor GreB, partial [Betaproteobacteria bacterium]|nr:transcription elongation factor GreB [Betaproteobacteria bacterium]